MTTEEHSEFVERFGPIQFTSIKTPARNAIFTRPHVLNYFKDGRLHRTQAERGSARFELFFDLLYVGIIANLAKSATEEADGKSLVKYVALFAPAWQIWSDMREFMNYFYNNDLSQKFYVVWQMALLVAYANNANDVMESPKMVVGVYLVSRASSLAMTVFYSFFVKEVRFQMRLYSVGLACFLAAWISVIYVEGARKKLAAALVLEFLEPFWYVFTIHPWTKRLFKLKTSTATNIEHDVERFSAFYIIALGEFLYGIVASSPAALNFNPSLGRAILSLLIAYNFLWLYFLDEDRGKAVHALRRSAWSACVFFFAHLPLAGALILAADAASDMVASNVSSTKYVAESAESSGSGSGEGGSELIHTVVRFVIRTVEGEHGEEEEIKHLYSLTFFFSAGLGVALICLALLVICDKSLEASNTRYLSRNVQALCRIPFAMVIIFLPFAKMSTTLLMGVTAILTNALVAFETWAMLPRNLCDAARSAARELEEHIDEVRSERRSLAIEQSELEQQLEAQLSKTSHTHGAESEQSRSEHSELTRRDAV